MEKRSRKRSHVWTHFIEIAQTDKNTPRRAKCTHCLQSISLHNGNVGNLDRHLKRKHPAIWTFQYENPYREDSLSSLDKSNSDDDKTLDKYEKATNSDNEEKQDRCENATNSDNDEKKDKCEKANVHNDKYEKVYVLSCENNIESNSCEEYEYLEEITPPKKKKQKYSRQNINHRHNRNSNYSKPERREHREQERSYIDDNRSDIFGRLVRLKMLNLDKDQRLFAEKLINDTLHEAELGNLNRFCCISALQMIHANEEPVTNDDKNAPSPLIQIPHDTK